MATYEASALSNAYEISTTEGVQGNASFVRTVRGATLTSQGCACALEGMPRLGILPCLHASTLLKPKNFSVFVCPRAMGTCVVQNIRRIHCIRLNSLRKSHGFPSTLFISRLLIKGRPLHLYQGLGIMKQPNLTLFLASP